MGLKLDSNYVAIVQNGITCDDKKGISLFKGFTNHDTMLRIMDKLFYVNMTH